ncbi:hypothetical protein B0T14DRAFT_600425 [Immersiella caudata]|uniref:Uncharacterized protein n=1 Tax=Immersiella caudata TaxID=314043 RepID=A0AA40C767_9PEZI|nr:hypothetical protein B0T14DRAFT_600425 [Immersiella caudata]
MLLEKVLITIRDLEIQDDRFATIKEQLTRGYQNLKRDVAVIESLTKKDITDFFRQSIHPASPQRAKLAIHFIAQANISELVKGLELNEKTAAQAATDLQARLSAVSQDEEIGYLRNYLLDLKVTESKISAAAEIWRKLLAQNKDAPSSNGTSPIRITDVRDFKSGLTVTGGARPVTDLSEFEELEP